MMCLTSVFIHMSQTCHQRTQAEWRLFLCFVLAQFHFLLSYVTFGRAFGVIEKKKPMMVSLIHSIFMVWSPEKMLVLEARYTNKSSIYIISHVIKLTSRSAVRKQRQNSDPLSLILERDTNSNNRF